MVSKILVALCVLVAVASAIPSPPAVGGPPAWLASAPWYPQWKPCATIGSACVDCTTKSVCTPIGGMQKACTDPTLPYCNLGECSATPTTACAPVQAVPAAGTV